MNWDDYYISIADVVRQKSKDASSKIGAVIVDRNNSILSTGFNGFPRGIDETIAARWERPIKYEYVEHAERNAIYSAARNGVRLNEATMYMVGFGKPTTPCINRAKAVIQSGIRKVVGCAYKPADATWQRELEFSKKLLREAGIEFVEYERLTK